MSQTKEPREDDEIPIKRYKHEDYVARSLQNYFYAGDVDNVLRVLDEEKITDLTIKRPNRPHYGKPRHMINEAARLGNIRMALELEKRGSDGEIRLCRHYYNSNPKRIPKKPISIAIKHGNTNFVREYVKYFGDKEEEHNIASAAQYCNFEALKILVERRDKDPDAADAMVDALCHACETGQNEMAKYLLGFKDDMEFNDNDSVDDLTRCHPFFISVSHGNHEMVDLIFLDGCIEIGPDHKDENENNLEFDPCTRCALEVSLVGYEGSLLSLKKILCSLQKHNALPDKVRWFTCPEYEVIYMETLGSMNSSCELYVGNEAPYILRPRAAIVTALLCARLSPASPFHSDAFALDVFKIIFKMCRLFLLEDER